MPLLAKEPTLYPDERILAPADAGADEAPWWVLHTRPRAEKAVARKLLTSEVAFFLPLYEKRWPSRGRLLCSYLPLFAGYVFARGDDVHDKALKTNQVARILPVPDPRRLCADLSRVYRL